MKEVTAYRCEHCGKLYLREFACKTHEQERCMQNPQIQPLCYSCEHYEPSWLDEEKEEIEYCYSCSYDGDEYYTTKLFSPNKCSHPDNNHKLYNNVKLSEEMIAGLEDKDYYPMPTLRTGGCNHYSPIEGHPYSITNKTNSK